MHAYVILLAISICKILRIAFTDSARTAQKTLFVLVMKANPLTQYREIIRNTKCPNHLKTAAVTARTAKFSIQKFCISPTQCICPFRITPSTATDSP